jgi:phosphatidate phosphatase APP1
MKTPGASLVRAGRWFAAAWLLAAAGWLPAASSLDPDEEVIFYSTLGRRAETGWECDVRGCVFEFERRAAATALLRRFLGQDADTLEPEAVAVFRQRTRLFTIDHKRGKRVTVEVARNSFTLGPTRANGQLQGRILVSDELVGADSPARRLPIRLVGKTPLAGAPSAEVHLLPEQGLSVISDVDDTIKISQVSQRRELLRNTFCRPWQPVAGMPELYQAWAGQSNATFHYVSASPWQLYLPLWEFLGQNHFPTGTVHLREFRLTLGNAVAVLRSPVDFKRETIEPILNQYPQRCFMLVGDSGEKDPEAYAALARKYPRQIVRILIRDITGESLDSGRYQRAFAQLRVGLAHVFRDPAELSKGP